MMDGSEYTQIMMDPDPGGQKTYRSRSGSTTMPFAMKEFNTREI
jgi:hypothetical protein